MTTGVEKECQPDGHVVDVPSQSEPLSGDCVILPIDDLLPADSPRLQGEDVEHIQALAQLDVPLPPILVRRETMRVIDGMHRLKVAQLRGERTIAVTFYDGNEADAFVTAVKMNIQHGLPLSLSDRKAAAARIIQATPHRSDRAIAEVSGLSAKTVGAIRTNAMPTAYEADHRIGRDGRVRPLTTVDGRRYASELISVNPDASSREIARRAGISPSTVRDVRERLQRGEDPVPTRQRSAGQQDRPACERKLLERIKDEQDQTLCCREEILFNLSRDPAVRMTEHGRAMLRWLHSQSQQTNKDWGALANRVPDHCMYMVADFAYSLAESWIEVASEFRRRASFDQ